MIVKTRNTKDGNRWHTVDYCTQIEDGKIAFGKHKTKEDSGWRNTIHKDTETKTVTTVKLFTDTHQPLDNWEV